MASCKVNGNKVQPTQVGPCLGCPRNGKQFNTLVAIAA